MSQPFYHLRPNKYVDRCLFVAALERINTIIKLNSHRYIGFGSYLFDDFKLLHDRLDISSMISLEADSDVYKRALYNIPYSCIRVENQTSTDFIAGGEWGADNTIIWLDYTAPSAIAQQFNDIASLSNILNPHDIVRVTFNASPVNSVPRATLARTFSHTLTGKQPHRHGGQPHPENSSIMISAHGIV